MGKNNKVRVLDIPTGRVTETAKEVLVHSTFSSLGRLAEEIGVPQPEGILTSRWFRGQAFLARPRGQARGLFLGQPQGGITVKGDTRVSALDVIRRWLQANPPEGWTGKETGRLTDTEAAVTVLVPQLFGSFREDTGWLEDLAEAADPLKAGVNFSQKRGPLEVRVPSSLAGLLRDEVRASAHAWYALLNPWDRPDQEAIQEARQILEHGTGFEVALAGYAKKLKSRKRRETIAQVAAVSRVALPEPTPEPKPEPAALPEPKPEVKALPMVVPPQPEAPEKPETFAVRAARAFDRGFLALMRVGSDLWRGLWRTFLP